MASKVTGLFNCHVGLRNEKACTHRLCTNRISSIKRISDRKVLSCATPVESPVVAKQAEGKQQTLFAKLGGAPAVKAAVDLFYDKMLADPRVNYFFDGVDMRKQRAHQAGFLTFAMGGSDKYVGNANMTSAHARLAREAGMRMEHFDIVLEHLGGALRDLKVPEEEVAEAAALVETLRPAFQSAIDAAKE